MRLSNYNYVQNDKKNLIIYNTLNNRVIKISSQRIKDSITKNSVKELGKEDILMLKEQGVMTDLSFEEECGICNKVFWGKVYSGFLDITLITTTACNFRCKYCAQAHSRNMMSDEVYDNLIKYVVKNIYRFNTLKLVLFGGEPTLAFEKYIKYLDKITELCKYYKKKFIGVMITNGYLLDIGMVKQLYARNITQFQITLDGSPENHDECRVLADGKGSFDVVYNNLLSMLEAKELRRLSVAIRINTTRELLDDIDAWASFYEPFSRDKRFLINLGVVENRGGVYIQSFEKELINETDDIYIDAKKSLSEHKFYEDFLCENYFVCKEINDMAFTLDYDGKIRTCSKLYTDNVKGYLNDRGIIEFNKRFEQFCVKTNKECTGCVFEPLCHGKSCGLKNVCEKNNIELLVNNYMKNQINKGNYEII